MLTLSNCTKYIILTEYFKRWFRSHLQIVIVLTLSFKILLTLACIYYYGSFISTSSIVI